MKADAGALTMMLDDFLQQQVVVDLASPFVCLGKLTGIDEFFLELRDADVHDLRDTHTTRENYTASSIHTGIKRNRKRVLLARREIVAIARLSDVVGE